MRSAMACFSVTGFCDCRANHFVQKLALREWTSGAVTTGMIFGEGPVVGRAKRVRPCSKSRAAEGFGPMMDCDEEWALDVLVVLSVDESWLGCRCRWRRWKFWYGMRLLLVLIKRSRRLGSSNHSEVPNLPQDKYSRHLQVSHRFCPRDTAGNLFQGAPIFQEAPATGTQSLEEPPLIPHHGGSGHKRLAPYPASTTQFPAKDRRTLRNTVQGSTANHTYK